MASWAVGCTLPTSGGRADTPGAARDAQRTAARAGETDRKLGEEVCADAYITKPIEPGLLIAKIKELIK